MFRVTLVLIGSGLLASVAGAHPGHGVVGQGWSLAHQWSEPVHGVLTLALTGAAVVAAGWLRGRRRPEIRTHR